MSGEARTAAPASRGREIGLWVLQVLVALAFLMAGASKLAGVEMMVQMFDKVGFGQWFRYLTGTVEVACAIMLLIPALAGVGALLLVPTMIAAVGLHLFILGGSPAAAAVLGALAAVIAWGRRDRTRRLIPAGKTP